MESGSLNSPPPCSLCDQDEPLLLRGRGPTKRQSLCLTCIVSISPFHKGGD